MIAPTLACANYLELQKDIEAMDRAGTEFYHIDIMDGHYVPNVCLNFEFIEAVRSVSTTPMDVHLMVTNPMDYIGRLSDCGVQYVSAHADVLREDVEYFIQKVHKYNMKAGVALAPEDTVEQVIPYLKKLDYVLVMFVKPGFAGQSFQEAQLTKVEQLRRLREEQKLSFLIEADGGIGWDNIGRLKEAGVDIAVAGVFAVFDQKETLYESTVKFRNLSNEQKTTEKRGSEHDGAA